MKKVKHNVPVNSQRQTRIQINEILNLINKNTLSLSSVIIVEIQIQM